tara:strand:- start:1192 stop:1833 length:642 start_codon:yes stop_codon:yes gene_type:complete
MGQVNISTAWKVIKNIILFAVILAIVILAGVGAGKLNACGFTFDFFTKTQCECVSGLKDEPLSLQKKQEPQELKKGNNKELTSLRKYKDSIKNSENYLAISRVYDSLLSCLKKRRGKSGARGINTVMNKVVWKRPYTTQFMVSTSRDTIDCIFIDKKFDLHYEGMTLTRNDSLKEFFITTRMVENDSLYTYKKEIHSNKEMQSIIALYLKERF